MDMTMGPNSEDYSMAGIEAGCDAVDDELEKWDEFSKLAAIGKMAGIGLLGGGALGVVLGIVTSSLCLADLVVGAISGMVAVPLVVVLVAFRVGYQNGVDEMRSMYKKACGG